MGSPNLRVAVAGLFVLATLGPPGTASAAVAEPFVVTHDGTAYKASNSAREFSGSLKSVVEKAVDYLDTNGGGTIQFNAGDYDLGPDWFDLHDVHDVAFVGAGMTATTIHNNASVATDTEPFDFSGAFGVTVRDLTVHAGGPYRSTSDALDFDNGNNVLVQNVKVTGSRGRGIVFDGKNDAWDSARNRVTGCIVTGVPSDGIELLASTDNVVEGCTITNVGGHGIQLAKSSSGADQPNKPPSRNTIRNNTIDQAGQDGINVNGGSANLIQGNTITNSSDDTTSKDGIRIGSNDAVPCDDNQVRGNTATDNQSTKTQRYGLNIATALCNRTVIGADNDVSGNRVGPINDLGTATIYEGEVPNRRPSAQDLVVTAVPGVPASWAPVVTDADGDSLTCRTTLPDALKGAASVAGDCSSGTYTPNADATGTDVFDYRVSDGELTDVGRVTVTIAPANESPAAGDVSVALTAGTATLWTPVVEDPHQDPLTCEITTPPRTGTATVVDDCSGGDYRAPAGATGSDSFVYTVKDDKGATDTGTVTVTISAPAPTNEAPSAGGVGITLTAGTTTSWAPVVSDPDQDPLDCRITTPPSKGIATVADDCSGGEYRAPAGATGTDSFVYTVSDGKLTDTGTVTVTITAPNPSPGTGPAPGPAQTNAAPVAGGVSITTTAGSARSWTPVVSDADGGSLTCRITTSPSKGTATVAENCSAGTYLATSGATGSDSFAYSVSDGKLTDTGAVTVTITSPTSGTSRVVLGASADASAKRSTPRRNYGSAKTLRVDKYPRARSYLKFMVPELAGEVESVTLRLYTGAASTGGLKVRAAGDAWREGRVCWRHQPVRRELLARVSQTAAGGWTEINLPVSSISEGRLGFALMPRTGADIRVRSSESRRAPQLVLVTQ